MLNFINELDKLFTKHFRILQLHSKTIILSNADIISDIDYYEMLNYHYKKKSMLTVSAKIINEIKATKATIIKISPWAKLIIPMIP